MRDIGKRTWALSYFLPLLGKDSYTLVRMVTQSGSHPALSCFSSCLLFQHSKGLESKGVLLTCISFASLWLVEKQLCLPAKGSPNAKDRLPLSLHMLRNKPGAEGGRRSKIQKHSHKWQNGMCFTLDLASGEVRNIPLSICCSSVQEQGHGTVLNQVTWPKD